MLISSITTTLCRALAFSSLSQYCGDVVRQYGEATSLLTASDDFQAVVNRPGPPHGPHHPPDVSNKTIFQFLQDDERFSRLFKFVNMTDSVAIALNDTKSSVSLFAPPNSALKPPKPPKHDLAKRDEDDIIQEIQSTYDYSDAFALLEGYENSQGVEDDDEHKKKVFKKIVEAVLLYHILPGQLTADELAKNVTYPTSLVLHDGSLDGESERIRVATVPRPIGHPTLSINFFTRVVVPDIKTSNGLVHVVDSPLFPPPSAFQALFLLSDIFSTFTSAIQRVHLTDEIEWRYVRGKGDDKGALQGSPAVTVFAPTNKAFSRLPKKLKLFLFSPFGERLLKKLLQFHVVPNFVLHSDWTLNTTSSGDNNLSENVAADYIDFLERPIGHDDFIFDEPHHPHHPPNRPKPPPHIPRPDVVYSRNISAPTLLSNHTLHVHVVQLKRRLPIPPQREVYFTELFVEGLPVRVADAVARNGAVHVISKLLNPVKHHHPHLMDNMGSGPDDEWNGWEEWLLDWANEN